MHVYLQMYERLNWLRFWISKERTHPWTQHKTLQRSASTTSKDKQRKKRPRCQASIHFKNLEHDVKMLFHYITLKKTINYYTLCIRGINLSFSLIFHYIGTFHLITNLSFLLCFPLQTHRNETSVCICFVITQN